MRFNKWFLAVFAILLSFGVLFYSRKAPETGDWMDLAIARDFQRFDKNGISLDQLESTWLACRGHKEFLRYQIIDSKVYGSESRIKIFLEELLKRYPVPNVDFIYYYEDRLKNSFFQRKQHRNSAPIFVSAKNRSNHTAILFTDWIYDIRDQSSGWNWLIQTVNEEYAKCDWSQKIEKLLWRGKPWDGKHFGMYNFQNWKTLPRGRIVAESQKCPDLIDAAFSEYPKACSDEDPDRCIKEMGALRPTTWQENVQYKYQILIDGVTCTFPAVHWKLLSGSLCFKQASEDIQYFYDDLIPWKHFVPVRNDLSDIREKILWANTHDLESREIAENARKFALTHLMPEHIQLYCFKVLCKYASLQKFEPSIQ